MVKLWIYSHPSLSKCHCAPCTVSIRSLTSYERTVHCDIAWFVEWIWAPLPVDEWPDSPRCPRRSASEWDKWLGRGGLDHLDFMCKNVIQWNSPMIWNLMPCVLRCRSLYERMVSSNWERGKVFCWRRKTYLTRYSTTQKEPRCHLVDYEELLNIVIHDKWTIDVYCCLIETRTRWPCPWRKKIRWFWCWWLWTRVVNVNALAVLVYQSMEMNGNTHKRCMHSIPEHLLTTDRSSGLKFPVRDLQGFITPNAETLSKSDYRLTSFQKAHHFSWRTANQKNWKYAIT